MHFQIALILVFCIFHNFPSFAQYCGRKPISSFKTKLKYEPDQEGAAPLEVKREDRNSFAGGNGKVFIGYVKKSATYEGCVAIKIFNQNFYNVYENSKNFMQKIQSILPPDERKHLITMVDAGKLKKQNNRLVIMELGLQSLEKSIYEKRKAFENDSNLFEDLKKIVEPISELHKVAIHGDIKPNNFMYVKKVGENETLKLIDYDGATFIPVGLFENPRRLANKVVPREFYVATPTYAAIEYYEDMLVSTKMDMWALGIIIYELILVQESFNERISVGKITQILLGIGNIYLGMQRNSKGEKQSDESLFENNSWVKKNYASLMTILNVWQKYPKTAIIIANLLRPDKEARMSAIGVKSFLSGLCLTEELKNVENAAQLHFFNRFTFGEFYKMLNDKNKTVLCSCTSNTASIYEELLAKTERVMRIVQGTMNELRGGRIGSSILYRLLGRTCDTERNG